MKKIFKILLLGGALLFLSGCASSLVTKGGLALENQSKRQTIQHNEVVLNNDCVTADASATASAMAKAGISPGKKMSQAQEKLFMYYYEELKPECTRGKRGAAVTGGRYNVSPTQLAWMEQESTCTRASFLMRSLQGREVFNVVEEGSPLQQLYLIQEDCGNWRNERRADYALKSQERRADKAQNRRFWSRFIAPYPRSYRGYGYRGGSYYGSSYYPSRAIGIGWRKTPTRAYGSNSSKCKNLGSFYSCSSSGRGSSRYNNNYKSNSSLVYNNPSLRY